MLIICKNGKCRYRHISELQIDQKSYRVAKIDNNSEKCPKCNKYSLYAKEDYFFANSWGCFSQRDVFNFPRKWVPQKESLECRVLQRGISQNSKTITSKKLFELKKKTNSWRASILFSANPDYRDVFDLIRCFDWLISNIQDDVVFADPNSSYTR